MKPLLARLDPAWTMPKAVRAVGPGSEVIILAIDADGVLMYRDPWGAIRYDQAMGLFIVLRPALDSDWDIRAMDWWDDREDLPF